MKYSFIIPVYNIERFIEKCLMSVEAALIDFIDITEVIIVDDGSKDRTIDIVKDFIDKSPIKVTLVKHATNLGLSTARNTGITHASGEFVIMLDGDNLLNSQTIDFLNYYIKTNPNIDVFILAMDLIDEAGKEIGYFYGDYIKENVAEHLMIRSPKLLSGNFIDNFSAIRRDIFEQERYDVHLRSLEDWDFWIRLLWIREKKFYYLPEVCGSYRVRKDSLSNQHSLESSSYLNTLIQIYSKMLMNSSQMQLSEETKRAILQLITQLANNLINKNFKSSLK